jgi:hypothetical protein
MRKNPNNKSGLFNLRSIIAFSLCGIAIFFGTVALRATQTGATTTASASLPDPCQYLSANTCTALHNDQALVASIKEQMKGGFVSKTQAVLTADGSTLPSVTLNDPSPEALQAVSTLPLPLQAPVAGIYSAVLQARDLMGGSLPADQVQQGQVAIASFLSEGSKAMNECLRLKKSADQCQAALPQIPSFSPAIQHAMSESRPAALLVAMALDKYLVALQAAAAQLPSKAGQAVAPCDLLDQTPYLCVGSTGNSTYTADEMLLIDLGGDDTFENSAGASPALNTNDPTKYYPISINLHLGGNVTYSFNTSNASSTNPFGIAQGAVDLGGVGELIQLEGTASLSYYGPGCSDVIGGCGQSSWAQGAAAGGVGIVFNGGTGNFSAAGQVAPTAQGVGILGGVGAVVSTGMHDDSYSVSGALASPTLAQAVEWDGVGLIFDDGGNDTFTVTVQAAGPDNFVAPIGRVPSLGDLEAQAIAGLDGGVALLIEGAGSHRYNAEIDATGAGYAFLKAQAFTNGLTNSTAVLDDAGGPNTYTINYFANDSLRLAIDNSCNCDQAVEGVSQQVGYYVVGQAVSTYGLPRQSSNAALIDEAGDAAFSVNTAANLDASLADHLTQPVAAANLSVAGGAFGLVSAQADGELGGGTSILLTSSGAHSFKIDTHERLTASAASDHASAMPVAIAVAYPPVIAGQGARGIYTPDGESEGALLDLAGDRSNVETSQDVVVVTTPNDWGALRVPGYIPSMTADATLANRSILAQGDFGTLAVLGSAPRVFSHPAIPEQAGLHHGFGVWGEAGMAPLATGVAPTLQLTSVPPAINPDDGSWPWSPINWPYYPVNPAPANAIPRIPLTARLTDQQGTPIAGATLHFVFEATQQSSGLIGGKTVSPVWQTDAVTDASGNANALLSIWGTKFLGTYLSANGSWYEPNFGSINGGTGPVTFQVTVAYDGTDGVYPAWATQTLPLLPAVQLNSVGSRKAHGQAGTFDINLPLSGNPGIECRSGGANGDYTLVFTFANTLTSVGGASVTSGTGTVSSKNIDSNDAHNYIVNLTGVTNAQVLKVGLTNLSDSAGDFSTAVSASMGVLVGDVNASRLVDSGDVFLVRQQTGQTVSASNFREDVNASGLIDSGDVFLTRQQTGTSLP